MKVEEIKVGMVVVCKEPHYNDRIYWARPEMDAAVGKPMKVLCVDEDARSEIVCQYDTDCQDDDGIWGFLADWLEPWKGERLT